MADKRLRIIAWTAVSSLAQVADDKDSLPRQLSDILEDPLFTDATVIDTIRIPGHSRAYTNFDRFVAGCAVDGIFDPRRMYRHLETRDFDVLVVRDGTRLGREWGIFGELVQIIINAGARIYVQNGFGWVDHTNIDVFIMTNGYASTKQIKDLVRYREMGSSKNVALGRKMGGKPPRFFIELRDPQTLKPVGMKPNREVYQRFFDDFVTAYCDERIPYKRLGEYLYNHFGHIDPKTSRPFSTSVFQQLLFSPATWGHTVYGRRRKQNRNGADVQWGYWITGDELPPEGVKFYTNTVEAVWPSPTMERVKAEFKHRHYVMKGRMGSRTRYLFSGLLVCGECGRSFSGCHAQGKYRYYRCTGRFGYTKNDCENGKFIREEAVKDWMAIRLGEIFSTAAREVTFTPSVDIAVRVQGIDKEIVAVEASIERDSSNLGSLGANVDTVLRRKIESYNAHIDRLRAQRATVVSNALASEQQAVDKSEALKELQTMGMDAIWQQHSFVINQWLHRYLGSTRIAIVAGECMDFVTPAGG